MPADGPVRVVAQPLGVSDGDQEQIQCPGTVLGAGKIIVADQAMVHPTEAGGNLAQPLRPQDVFGNHHDGGSIVVGIVSGLTQPRMFRPRSSSWRAVDAMSSCNVLPVTMEISPTNAGSCARQQSCNVAGRDLGTLQEAGPRLAD